jgi:hypothetical protein
MKKIESTNNEEKKQAFLLENKIPIANNLTSGSPIS